MVANDFELYKNLNINPPVAYSAIKGGVIGFTKFLASYLGHIILIVTLHLVEFLIIKILNL